MKILKCIKYFIRQILLVIAYFFTNLRAPKKNDLEGMKTNKPYRVKIPTYDGSGQVVHPSVVYLKAEDEYFLAFTPYTNTNDKVENPSVVISNNCFCFKEEIEGLNPLVQAPCIDHNDDPNLFIENNEYKIIYLETLRPERQNLILLSSLNRIKWSKKTLFSEKCNDNRFILSPSYLKFLNRIYVFYVNKIRNQIEYVVGNCIESINYNEVFVPNLESLYDVPWHLDIQGNSDGFVYLLITCVKNKKRKNIYYLKIARSRDLINWDVAKKVVFNNCYRSSFFFKNKYIYFFLSRIYFTFQWKVSFMKCKISDLF